jgi:hypothetical protein
MSQTLFAGHGSAVTSVIIVAAKLPHPKPAVTIPIIVIFAILVFVALARKVIGLAIVAAVVCIGFLAYQAGAFNHWVDKGKSVVNHK